MAVTALKTNQGVCCTSNHYVVRIVYSEPFTHIISKLRKLNKKTRNVSIYLYFNKCHSESHRKRFYNNPHPHSKHIIVSHISTENVFIISQPPRNFYNKPNAVSQTHKTHKRENITGLWPFECSNSVTDPGITG